MPVKVPKGLEVYDADDTKEAWARILMIGAPKTGKTTSVATTAPKPVLIINCDDDETNKSALVPAKNFGADFKGVNVRNIIQWHAAIQYAQDLAAAEEVQTVVLDTLTYLGRSLVEDLKKLEWGDSRQMWGELFDEMLFGLRDLMRVEAHFVCIAHAIPNETAGTGVLPAVQGRAANYIPGMFADCIWFDLDLKQDPERAFLVGPQGVWLQGARHAKRSERLKADVTGLIKKLGMEP